MSAKKRLLSRLSFAAIALSLSASAQAAQVTENFNTAASTAANGWVGFNNTTDGNNFGFSDTNNVLGGANNGEAGGVLLVQVTSTILPTPISAGTCCGRNHSISKVQFG